MAVESAKEMQVHLLFKVPTYAADFCLLISTDQTIALE